MGLVRGVAALITVIGAIPLAIAVWLYLGSSRDIAAAADWRTVTGQVLESGVRTARTSGRSGQTYHPDIAYRYEVNGRPYAARRVWLVLPLGSDAVSARRLADRHPPGSPVTVHYDPADPAQAALYVETPLMGGLTMIFLAVFGLVFIAVGGNLLLISFKRRRV